MQQAEPTYLIIGKICSTHGVRGWLKVQSFTENHSDIFNYQPWFTRQRPDMPWQPIAIEDSRLVGAGDMVLVKFTHLHTPETARLLTNQLIAVHKTLLAPLKQGEYYWSDLIGLSVIDQDGQVLGKVVHLLETGSNDVLVVKDKKEIAIPYLLGETIQDVDLEKQVIHVKWDAS